MAQNNGKGLDAGEGPETDAYGNEIFTVESILAETWSDGNDDGCPPGRRWLVKWEGYNSWE
jgi:hypothetical protein